MAKSDILNQWSHGLDSFEVHEKLVPELLSIVSKSGLIAPFTKLFLKRLGHLNEFGASASDKLEEFERIDEEIYSMHLSGKGFNIRILYSFLDDGTILLHCFYERGGKRNTDYTNSLPEAKRRKHSMMEDSL